MVITLKDLGTLFYEATITMTALPVDKVRLSYPPNGQPGFEQAQDVCFITITELDDPWSKQRDITHKKADWISANRITTYTRVMQAAFVFYGPNSYDLADQVRWRILEPDIKDLLAASEVFPVPTISAPQRAPELKNDQWWERTDLKVMLYVGTSRTVNIPILAGATIQIITDTGITRTLHIPVLPEPTPLDGGYLLLEDGSTFLLEDGRFLLFETGTLPEPTTQMTTEDGAVFLTQDGNVFQLNE